MSYETVVAGLHARFLTVAGLPQYDSGGASVNILTYEPTSIQTSPVLYTLLDRFERVKLGQVTAMRYRSLHRVCFRWQDSKQAEAELRSFVNSIPAAVDADKHLGGVLNSGIAQIVDGQAGWVNIGGTECRTLDLYSEVLEK